MATIRAGLLYSATTVHSFRVSILRLRRDNESVSTSSHPLGHQTEPYLIGRRPPSHAKPSLPLSCSTSLAPSRPGSRLRRQSTSHLQGRCDPSPGRPGLLNPSIGNHHVPLRS